MDAMTKRRVDNIDYKNWLKEHASLVRQYAESNDVVVKDFQIDAHAFNVLRMNGINRMSQLVVLTPEEIRKLPLLGGTDAAEILLMRSNYLVNNKEKIFAFVAKAYTPRNRSDDVIICAQPTNETEKSVDISQKEKFVQMPNVVEQNDDFEQYTKVIQYYAERETPIESLNLSVRANNALHRAQIDWVSEALKFYPDGFLKMRNLGRKTADEICRALESAMQKAYHVIMSGNGDKTEAQTDPENHVAQAETNQCAENSTINMTLPELLHHPMYKEKAERFLEANDVPLESMGLSARPYHSLLNYNYKSLSKILQTYPNNLRYIRSIGKKSVSEICQVVDSYMEELQPAMAAFCSGDMDAQYSDEYITEKLLDHFYGVGFEGLSFQQMREALPEEISEERIKKCIGILLASHKLEYVDFRCYRVYPSVLDVLEESTIENQKKEILRQRLSGKTLAEIAKEQGITRERVRQICQNTFRKACAFLRNTYGVQLFEEEFYTYLYTNYNTEKALWTDYLGVPNRVLCYLSNGYTRGEKQIEDAMNDPKVSVSLKFRIRDYLNRNKLLIDGILLENRRVAIEDYAIKKFCKDEMTYDDFVIRYNAMLRDNGVPFNEKLYYTDGMRRARSNRLSESMRCLWKQGERLRFYDILEHDYSELLETLNLEEFQNTEVSTLKFMNDYPDLMAKYDIRDQYELHNLLKKIVNPSTCRDITFSRQPIIRFGEFDRNKAIYEAIEMLSPITIDELIDYLQMEYGYDRATMVNYLLPSMQYYHNGVFSVSFKRVPEGRVQLLKDNLSDDFYFIFEIKEIYQRICPDADLDEINHRSLKLMGYTVSEKYILTRHKTSDSFFRDILLKDDVFSITPIRKRFGSISMYCQIWLELRRNMDILLFDKDQYLNIRRLEKFGVTKADLIDYCNRVFEEVPANSFFTVHSLNDQSDSKIDSLGFGELFFAELLASSEKFLHTHVFGTDVFYKGNLSDGLSRKYFCMETLKSYESVDLDDYIADLYENYGIKVPDKYDVISVINETDFYYDNIMQKIYRSKDEYYAEFDE